MQILLHKSSKLSERCIDPDVTSAWLSHKRVRRAAEICTMCLLSPQSDAAASKVKVRPDKAWISAKTVGRVRLCSDHSQSGAGGVEEAAQAGLE